MKLHDLQDYGEGLYPVGITLELPEADIVATAALFVANNPHLIPDESPADAEYLAGIGGALSQVVAAGAPSVEFPGQANALIVGYVLRTASEEHPEEPIRALAHTASETYEAEMLDAQLRYGFSSGDVPDAPPDNLV